MNPTTTLSDTGPGTNQAGSAHAGNPTQVQRRPPAALAWRTTRRRWRQLTGGHGRLLTAVLMGAMAAFTTMSMVNLAMPGIARQFQLAQGEVQWVASAFLLAMASALPAAPWLLQRWGVRACFGGATLALLLGAGLCAAGTSVEALLLGRVLQGLAAGLMQPVPLLLVQRCVRPAWRGRAAGLMATGTALAVAGGPLAGGLLIDRFGWPGMFALPLPLGLLSLGLLLASPRAADIDRLPGAAAQRLDWTGLVLASLAVAALMQGLSNLAASRSALAALALTVGALAAAAFVARQSALQPAMPPDLPGAAVGQHKTPPDSASQQVKPLVSAALLADARYRLSCLAALMYGLVLNAFTYLLPLWLHGSLGLPQSRTGLVLSLAGVAMVLVQPWAAAQVDLRPHRPVLGVGFGLLALALLLLPAGGAWAQSLGPAWVLPGAAAAALLCRVGLACAFAALFIPAQRALAPALQAQGATLAQWTQTQGGVLGVGLAALALQWGQSGQLEGAQVADATATAFQLLALAALLAAVLTWQLRSATSARTDQRR